MTGLPELPLLLSTIVSDPLLVAEIAVIDTITSSLVLAVADSAAELPVSIAAVQV